MKGRLQSSAAVAAVAVGPEKGLVAAEEVAAAAAATKARDTRSSESVYMVDEDGS